MQGGNCNEYHDIERYDGGAIREQVAEQPQYDADGKEPCASMIYASPSGEYVKEMVACQYGDRNLVVHTQAHASRARS